MKIRTFRLRQTAMFHASQSSDWCGTASVVSGATGWTVYKRFVPDASAIFYRDYLVYSERPEDKPQNYFGYVCETQEDVRLEIAGA